MSQNNDIDKSHNRKILIVGCGGVGSNYHISKITQFVKESALNRTNEELSKESNIEQK
jgi:cell division GTPase FtsZ